MPVSTAPAAKKAKPGVLRQLLSGHLSLSGAASESVPPALPGSTGSAIHPLMLGDEQAALDLSRSLQAEGFLVPAIRYPTVAKGAARLRITVTAAHDEAQVRALAGAIARLRPEAST
jgi:7-keto-8-aminopelargonate synthetase-like enzyme